MSVSIVDVRVKFSRKCTAMQGHIIVSRGNLSMDATPKH